jgi:hypothetical protein
MIHTFDVFNTQYKLVFLFPVSTSSFNMSTCSFYSRTHFNIDLKIFLFFIPFPFLDVYSKEKIGKQLSPLPPAPTTHGI